MNNFCLNWSGFEGLGGTSLPKFLLNAPPPPTGGAEQYSPKYSTVYYTTFFYLF